MDELLGALEGVSGTTARLVDIPPLEVEALRRSLAELGRDAGSLPAPDELARVFDGLRETARREQATLLEVSVGVGLAFFNSARHVGRQHLLDPYREDLRPVGDEGFAAYARRVSRPYAAAVARHFDASQATLTERGLDRLRRSRLTTQSLPPVGPTIAGWRPPPHAGRETRSGAHSGSSPGWRHARTARGVSVRSPRAWG